MNYYSLYSNFYVNLLLTVLLTVKFISRYLFEIKSVLLLGCYPHAFRKIKRNAFKPVRAREREVSFVNVSLALTGLNAFRFIFRNAWG